MCSLQQLIVQQTCQASLAPASLAQPAAATAAHPAGPWLLLSRLQRRHMRGLRLVALALSALGVVYGDIGELSRLWAQALMQAVLPHSSDRSLARWQLAHCPR